MADLASFFGLGGDSGSYIDDAIRRRRQPVPPAPAGATGEMTAYSPSGFENLADYGAQLAHWLSGKPLGEARQDTKTILGMAPIVGTAESADQARADFAQGNYGGAALNAGGALLDALPGGGAAEAMLIGPLAKLFDPNMAKLANQMEMAGASDLDIWKATKTPTSSGTIIGAEGAIKQEIPDVGSSMKKPLVRDAEGRMGDFFNHPEGYAAYPKLEKMYTGSSIKNLGARGSYRPRALLQPPEVNVNPHYPPDIQRSTILHEGFGHGVQDIEGWGMGGNTRMFKPGTPAWEIYQELKAQKPQTPDQVLQNWALEDAYFRSSGEAEARNIQRRADMTLDELFATPWHETLDVPTAQQLVHMKR